MNKTFKVARSLTRGTVVTSEAASSRQGKALKTVVTAVAAALVAGGALAAATENPVYEANQNWTADAKTYSMIWINNAKEDTKVTGGDIVLEKVTEVNDPVAVLFSNVKGGSFTFNSVKATGAYLHGLHINQTTGGTNLPATFDATIGTFDFQSDWKNTSGNGEASSAISTMGGPLNATIGTLTGKAGHAISAENQWAPGTAADKKWDMSATVVIEDSMNFEATDAAISAKVRTTHQNASIKLDAKNASVTLKSDTDAVLAQIGTGNKEGATQGSGSASVAIDVKTIELTGKNSALNAASTTTNGDSATITLKAGTAVLKTAVAKEGEKAGAVIQASGNGAISITADDLTVSAPEKVAAVDLKNTSKLNLAGQKAILNGSLKGVQGTAIHSTVDNLTVGNAKDFKGNFHVDGGTTNVKATEFFTGKTVVHTDGTLNLLDLNSYYKGGLGEKVPEGTAKDQFLLTSDLVLRGGQITNNGAALERIKVGAKDAAGSLTLNFGDYHFTSLVLGQKGSATVGQKGNVTLDELNLTGMNTNDQTASFENKGSLTIGKVVAGVVNADKFTNTGTIYTGWDNLFKKASETADTYVATSFGTALKDAADTGTTFETVYEGNIKATEWQKAQTAVGNIVFTKATLVGEDGTGNALLSGIDGLNVETRTVDLKDTSTNGEASQSLTKRTTLGSVVVKAKDAETAVTSVKIEGSATAGQALTLRGANGQLITFDTGVDVTKVKSITLNNVVLGQEDTDSAVLDHVVTVESGKTLKVGAGNYTLKDVAGVGAVSAEGGNLTITGQVAELAKGTTTEKYKVLTIGSTADKLFSGSLTVKGGHALALGNWGAEAQAVREAIQAELDAEAARQSTATAQVKPKLANVLYIGQQTHTNVTPSFAGVRGDNTVYVNLATVAADANYDKTQGIFTKAASATAISADASIRVGGINAGVVTVSKTAGQGTINFGDAFADGVAVDYDNAFYDNGQIRGGVADITVDEETVYDVKKIGFNTFGDVEKAVYGFNESSNPIANAIYTQIDNWDDASTAALAEKLVDSGLLQKGKTVEEVVTAINSGNSALEQLLKKQEDKQALWNMVDSHDDAFINSLFKAEHAATNMAVLGGAFSTTLDVNDQVTAALNRRMTLANVNVAREVGATPWVDVFGTMNEGKRLFGNGAGYEADIYGAMLGVDYTAACGGVLGVALSVGTADANSVGNGQKVDNDQDFWGISAYASKQFGQFNTKIDLGYLNTSNDLSTSSSYFGATSESLDADVFTVGLGAELLTSVGSVNVVPHVGIRMTQLDMDDSKFGAEYDSMTVYQMPIGVAFSGTFETNGWKVAPQFDIAVVPTFGDKDAVASYTNGITDTTRVVDTNPVQATLGVAAQNGAWTFGLNYGLTAGGDDRMNNAFNANVRYTF